jgi:replicative DNA helicase
MSDGLKLLGSIIDNGSVHTLRDVSRDLLIDDEIELYDLMRSHYRRYGRIPAITTVEAELGIAIPEAEETTDYYIAKVHDRKLYNVVRDHFNQLKEHLRANNMVAVKEVIEEMRIATRIAHTDNDIRTLSEAVHDVMDEYDYAHENPGISGVPTGWPRFDLKTGGYQPGDLVTWVARPSMGKTYNVLHQARMAWQLGYNVLVVTMEMTIEQITRRLAAMHAGINPDFVRKGTLSTYAYRRLQAHVGALVGAERFRMFSGGLRKRCSDVELLIQEYRPDIVFIDGVYLMQPDSKRSMQKIEKVSEVFDDLKQMTLAHNLPVVVTTQFNRQAGKKGKDGSLENIAFTDAISTHSSLVVSLSEDPASVRTLPSGDKQSTRRLATFLKGREGESGIHTLNYSFTPMDFSEVTHIDGEVADEDGNTAVVPVEDRNAQLDRML